ncbi:MAG: glycosyltransferase family 2 protein [Clostridia bacterium]|nr:glycosyltransferase family 2 protein [Clostridia bacterium]
MNEKIVSVIVPIYGVEKYLDKCVESIVNQTYKNLEIILVDDGSPDNCPTMCDEWAKRDDRIKVIHKENGGQASARNKALDVMSGDYVFFVDSDDYILEETIETMLYYTKKNNADICVCSYIIDNGIKCAKAPAVKEKTICHTEELMGLYFKTPFINTVVWNKLYAADIFDELRFAEVRAKEDVMLMHEILHKSKTAIIIPDRLYVFRVRIGSTENSKFSEKQLLSIEAAKKRQEFVKKNYPLLAEDPTIKLNYIGALKNKCFQINRSFAYKKYRSVYEGLMKDMQREYDKLCKEDTTNINAALAEYKWVLDNPRLFRLKGIKVGIVKQLKQYVKKAIGFIKS